MKILKNLTVQVVIAIIIGIIVGSVWPDVGKEMKVVGETFINMIKMVIAPIIFLTIVLGIASMGDMKKVGRVGGKALIYFEVVTTFALVIGIIVANITKPGAGLDPAKLKSGDITKYAESAKEMDWVEFFTHIVPSNMFEAFAKGDILQILFFSVLFGLGLTAMGKTGKPVIDFFEKLSTIFFNILGIVMKLAPIGAFGGMAFTIGKYGIGTLQQLSMLMITVYTTMFCFVFIVLNIIAKMYGFSLWNYLKFIKEELLIVLGTSSSESVLPRMMDKMEKFGCSKPVVGLVIPTGYSFNLDGTTIYLSMATIFLAQVFHVDLSITQQLTIIAILMLTSKGAAAVTGGGFIVLASTLTAMQVIPVEGLGLLIGVDRFMSEARAIVNLIGNGVATIVVAKSENEFDEAKQQQAIQELNQKMSA
ncbi:dicarboxylate/amino acid:cation symporter [Aneurinibacillus aneurinilyticus]|uniref:Dicarboxylate/amino acid:cation symporter n=2 Tax=Aneurinibacillus aneurinilyticus TaxID=1391 RepID=A0A848CXE5_ANEAE|nr:dicarboxylate/amino acid:cation symporter [Aneurinibacillus aneurinilyticus]ERI07992.1 aerobic C4-dicarboxylate transport protein [Aneurinibacillus aneurinilyticus ATCC 12856]MCI1694372.1 dicarboxylate/amino acid:cation symporter [Aneurinibacillus aneurinilyticus]MED0671553.1 dicarboxylate/amino acid:cation symporter [Aneurinibacillus aneurinilyticus]MED0705374.1 dicarboxylate/amino acid:cation symporter [Aneurinibacillus aneurinilyticus]MED0725007.1 dicarboxylate/amino acid:cation symporte